ncbi:MAG: NADH-quinone oxidoreductase subunit NuoN [Geminicoccaceae bacterium]|nr:NADH-quinone oxidoreductase subunit NuoN [Geminicoccaceae bacterium]
MPALDLVPVLPELVLAAAALVLLLLGAASERRARPGEGGGEVATVVTPLVTAALVVAAVLALVLDKTPATVLGGHFRFDAFAAVLKLLVLLGAAASLLLVGSYQEDERIDRFEFPLLALLSALGMSLMVGADSLLGLYMAVELQSLPLYVMAAFQRDRLRSTEAGLKYFVLGALASGMLLYGCSLVYGFSGTLAFPELARMFGPGAPGGVPTGVLVGLVFVIAGLAFKLAAVPFHMWTPDVYEGAPTSVTAFLAAAPKLAALGLALRLLFGPFADWVPQWQQVIVLLAVASMLLGAFAGTVQTNIKRLMAYSGIANIGFALVGVAAGTREGVEAALVYMLIYLVMVLGTFGCILAMRREGVYVEDIAELAGLSERRPLMAAALAVLMFSLAGIPPLAGFFGKYFVFMAAVRADLVWLAVVGLLASVVAAYYYLRIVKLVYFDPAAEPFEPPAAPGLRIVTALSVLFVLGFVVVPGPVFAAAKLAAAALLR